MQGQEKAVQDRGADQAERDLWIYKNLLDLWSKENSIKTIKLQFLLAVNGLLISVIEISDGRFLDKSNWFIYLAGAVFSLIWTFSIGRTSLFQEGWQIKMRELQARYPNDPRFAVLETAEQRRRAPKILRWFGCMASKWYLLFSPFIFAVIWLVILIVTQLW